MAQYPPYAPDPYAADRALAQWAEGRGYALSSAPDLRWYQGWYPCIFLPAVARLGREVRASFGEASLALVEAYEADVLKQATGEDRQLVAFITSPLLTARAAVRSKAGGGFIQELSTGLGSLFKDAGSAGAVLGDPTFEARYEVRAPSREEGNQALPMPLRQLVLQAGWQGILEVRIGGLIFTAFDRRAFDPAGLEALIAIVGQVYQAALPPAAG